MNRFGAIDSNSELDAHVRACDSKVMHAQSYRLHIQRVDPNRNMARYYELSLEPTLFGEISLVRAWGRIGRRGQRRVDLFSTEK